MLHKRYILGIGILAACGIQANATVHLKSSQENGVTAKSAALTVDAYYHTPEGVTFAGLDSNGEFSGDYAYAPANKWLATEAEYAPASASFLWTYPISRDSNGDVRTGTSTTEQLNFRMKESGLFDAPELEATYGSQKKSYTMATDGVKYGEYGTWQNYAVNYQPSQTTTVGNANEILSTNDATATAYLNMVMAGGLFSDITLYGFGESFYYSDNFYLQSINALVYSEQNLTCDDIAVKVLKREKTTVSYDVEIARLTTDKVTPLGDNRYYVVFKCAEPQYITTAMQVILLPAEGKDTKFSPLLPLQKEYRASNMGTASLYSTFTFTGKKTKYPQCLDFFGTEVTDDDAGNSLGFINNWAIGVKGSYTEPAAVDMVTADSDDCQSDIIYNLNGIIVGKIGQMQDLPAGIYICNGKKIAIR